MELNAVSSYKSKLKDEARGAKATGKSGLIKKPDPELKTEEKPEISKMEGVRKALAKLGDDAKPLAIQGYIKKKFDIDMETTVISSYKTSISQKEAGKSAVIRKPASATPVKAAQDAISLDDIKAVKDLAERIGADNLQRLTEVLMK